MILLVLNLEVHVDTLMNFHAHCEKQVDKGKRIPDKTSLDKCYTSLVWRHLEYDDSVSSPVYRKYPLLLENV